MQPSDEYTPPFFFFYIKVAGVLQPEFDGNIVGFYGWYDEKCRRESFPKVGKTNILQQAVYAIGNT